MHTKIGKKWAQMAARLPGRTDNAIKNFLNTQNKRRQRVGLPPHAPSNACSGASNENQLIQSASEFFHDGIENSGGIQQAMHETTYAPPLSDINPPCMLSQDIGPYTFSFNQGLNDIKRIIESETCLPRHHGSIGSVVSTFQKLPSDHSESMHQNLGLGYSYDPDPDNKNLISYGCSIPGSHAFSNGNFSASRHSAGTEKVELPSLQSPETNNGNWITCSDTPPYNIHVQSPHGNASFLSDCASPRCDGLLEALVHESWTINCGKSQSSEKSSCSSVITLSDMMESTAVNICTAEWEETSDQRSPFSHQYADEHAAIASNSFLGFPPKAPSGEHNFLRPGALLESHWILRDSYRAKEASATCLELLGEDMSRAVVSLDSCSWNSLPSVCQRPEHH